MQQPPPPPPRQAAQQQQQQQGGVDVLRALASRPSAAAAAEGISLLQYDQLQQLQQQLQQQQQVAGGAGWVFDPRGCLMPLQQQQQQLAGSLTSGSILYSSTWSDPTASSGSRGPSLDSRGTGFDSSRGPSFDSRRSVDSRVMGYDSNRPSLDSRGASIELPGSVVAGLSPAVAAAVLQQGLLSPSQPTAIRQGQLLPQANFGTGQGQGPLAVAANVATLEQQIRQVELAIAQEGQQQQQQQLVSISEGLPLLGEPVPLQRGQSLNRRLSLNFPSHQPANASALLIPTARHMSLGGAVDGGSALQAQQQQQQHMGHMGHFLSTGDLPPVQRYNSSSSMQAPTGAYLSELLPDTGEMTLAHFMQQQQQQQAQLQQQQAQLQQQQQLFQQQAQGNSLALLPQARTGGDSSAAAAAAAGGLVRRPSLSIDPSGAVLLSTFHQQQQQQLVSPVGVGLQQQPGSQLSAAAAAGGSINGSSGMLSSEVQGQVRELLQQQAALSALQQGLQQELAAELHRLN
jgi:hypothetical protein